MTSAAISDSPDDTVHDAAAKMREQQTGSLLIMEGGSLVGIFTERDILKCVAEGMDPKTTSVRDVMTKDVVTIAPETHVRDAARIMFDHWFRHLPVARGEGDVVGIISLRDLLTLVAQSMEEPENLEVLIPSTLVRDRRIQRIEAGDLD